MEKKKLSTKDILAQARAQAGGGSKPAAAPDGAPDASPPATASGTLASETLASESASAETAAAEAPAPAKPVAKPAAGGGAPKSTKDILAAARAQAGGKSGGESAPAAPKPAASKPATEKPAAEKSAAPKPAAGGAKSTKDILAAARAQATGGSAPAPAAEAASAKPAAAKPAAKAVAKAGAPAVAGGAAPSVQEMLKAFREGKSGGAATAVAEAPPKTEAKPAGPIVPKIPQRPAPAAKPAAKKGEAAPRRNFLWAIFAAPFALAWALMTATGLIALLGTARFMFPNILVEPPSKFKVGPPADYPGGTVSNKWKAQFGIWIVHAEFQGKSLIYALSTVCTHLGCTPNWLEGEQKFKCPCHGSGFYITGVNFEGPAPRPLERFAIRKSEDGMLEVDKSQKFQQEMGQWEDTKSFVEVA